MNFIQNKIKNISNRTLVRIALGALLLILLVLVSFGLGVKVGFRKAEMSNRWGDSYQKMFSKKGPRPGMREMIGGRDGYMKQGSSQGQILSVSTSSVLIQDIEGVEKQIRISSSTAIRSGSGEKKITNLQPGDEIVVFGSGDADGSIQARLIRQMMLRTQN